MHLIKQLVLAGLLLVGLGFASNAQALTDCDDGDWVFISGSGWGAESHCSCANVNGGMYMTGLGYGYGYANGTSARKVRLQLWMNMLGGAPQFVLDAEKDGTQNPYSINGGGAYEGYARTWVPDVYSWTGWYRAICSQ